MRNSKQRIQSFTSFIIFPEMKLVQLDSGYIKKKMSRSFPGRLFICVAILNSRVGDPLSVGGTGLLLNSVG